MLAEYARLCSSHFCFLSPFVVLFIMRILAVEAGEQRRQKRKIVYEGKKFIVEYKLKL